MKQTARRDSEKEGRERSGLLVVEIKVRHNPNDMGSLWENVTTSG